MWKKLVRYFIIGATFFFIFINFKEHWHDITSVRFSTRVWLYLSLSLSLTCIAHVWSGCVWQFILKIFRQSLPLTLILKIYLISNLYKYLPGNIGHLYARIKAVSVHNVPLESAGLSVLLEPLLMAGGALSIGILSDRFGSPKSPTLTLVAFFVLLSGLLCFHPYLLNSSLKILRRLQKKDSQAEFTVSDYPILPLLGEIIFLLLRGAGFITIWIAFQGRDGLQVLPLLSAFSFAWLLGLIVPGAPGGMGVFEATAIALLDGQNFPPGRVLLTVSFYRVISILAELIGAGIGVICGRLKSK